MKLSDWLEANGLTAQQFAERIERAPSTVTRILSGVYVPDSTTMRRIIEETGGAVMPNDFFELPANGSGEAGAAA